MTTHPSFIKFGIGARNRISSFLGRSNSGSVAMLVALSMPIIVGFCALGAEVMYWQYTKRTLQGAADAASFSGAAQLVQGRDGSYINNSASYAAYKSGLHPVHGVTPVVASPPAGGAFAGDALAVEVTLQENLPRLFTGIFYQTDTITISARAVARSAGGRPACILALNKSANKAVSFAGSSELELDACDIASNSVANDAIDFSGATDVTAECASAVGGVDGAGGSLTLTDCAAPYEGTRSFPDPYDHLVMPLPGVCNSGLKADLRVNPSVSRTVSPGTVCAVGAGGSNVGIKGDIDFNPGVYIFNGVDVTVNATAELRGTDVTFLFTGGSTVTINGGADIELEAPDDPLDPWQGVLFFGDPLDSGFSHTLSGSSATSFTGVLYFPTSNVTFTGTNDANPNACTLLVADTIAFTGTSFFASDCANLGISATETAQVVLIVE